MTVAHTQDEGFHEIQLNGKQLVFLFMAATVISVLIFLLGVLVGRGVRAERGIVAENATTNAVTETTPPQQPAQTPAPTPSGSDPRTAAPPPATDDLSYFNRLEKQKAPAEQLKGADASAKAPDPKAPDAKAPDSKAIATTPDRKAAPEKAVAAPPPAPVPAPPPAAATTNRPAPAAAASSSEPAGEGFAVQIAALNVRGDAEAIARRLSSKGYTAYVLTPAPGMPSVFRVRVGKFPTRREADTVAAKLKKEEQFNPWVTR